MDNNLWCEVCWENCTVAVVDEFVDDENAEVKYKYFCEQHYQDYCNNEIEIPAARLEILASLYD